MSSLDAIHLAAAMSLGPDLGVVITYDERMRAAAGLFGCPIVTSPRQPAHDRKVGHMTAQMVIWAALRIANANSPGRCR
jgi:hypothetical protein